MKPSDQAQCVNVAPVRHPAGVEFVGERDIQSGERDGAVDVEESRGRQAPRVRAKERAPHLVPVPAQRRPRQSLKERLVITGRSRKHDLATVEEMCDRIIVLARSGHRRRGSVDGVAALRANVATV